jgi:hypothetical protein
MNERQFITDFPLRPALQWRNTQLSRRRRNWCPPAG